MSFLDNAAKVVGDAVGVVGGGPSQVKAGLAFASFRQKLLDQTKGLGATVGSKIGADFSNSFAAGAAPAASAARASELGKYTGLSVDPRMLGIIAFGSVGLLLLYLGARGKHA